MKLAVSDAHEGIKAAVSIVLSATWQRCRVHFMRNALAHAGKSGRRVVSAFIATAFAQDTAEAASTQWRNVADQIRQKVPKLAMLMDSAEQDVLAYMTFSRQHWTKLHSTNPIERLNGEIKRRCEVPRIGPCPPEDRLWLAGEQDGACRERSDRVTVPSPLRTGIPIDTLGRDMAVTNSAIPGGEPPLSGAEISSA